MTEKTGGMERAQKRALLLRDMIELACAHCGLNLTVYNGKIGFVDQEKRKIVALWSAKYHMPDSKVLTCPECKMDLFDMTASDEYCPYCGSVMQ